MGITDSFLFPCPSTIAALKSLKRDAMTTPVLFLMDQTGKRTGVVIEISHYKALLKKLDELRGRKKASKRGPLAATIDAAKRSAQDK
jgi:hypothetical protein